MNALRIAVLAGALVIPTQAQQGQPGKPATGPEAGESKKTEAAAAGEAAAGEATAGEATTAEAATGAQEKAPQYAKVVAETVRLRCFASGRSPFFEEELGQGRVVQVDERVGDYWRVLMPVGVIGYVHKNFTDEPVDGKVTAKGTNVSFRYRPRGSEVPVLLMPKGTSLPLLADAGQWWKVMHPNAPCWVAAADVEVTATETAALESALRETQEARQKLWQDAVGARAEAVAEEARLAALSERLETVDAAFRAEVEKPDADQDLSAIAASLATLLTDLPPEGPERERGEVLQRAIEQQQLLARARELADEPIKTRDEASEILTEKVTDPMARFDAIGWLRREQSMRAGERFYLYKGGRRLFEVTCGSGRYQLWMFDGVEVGLRGARGPGRSGELRQLDVLKLEVLQLPRDR